MLPYSPRRNRSGRFESSRVGHNRKTKSTRDQIQTKRVYDRIKEAPNDLSGDSYLQRRGNHLPAPSHIEQSNARSGGELGGCIRRRWLQRLISGSITPASGRRSTRGGGGAVAQL